MAMGICAPLMFCCFVMIGWLTYGSILYKTESLEFGASGVGTEANVCVLTYVSNSSQSACYYLNSQLMCDDTVRVKYHLTSDSSLEWQQYVPTTSGDYSVNQSVICYSTDFQSSTAVIWKRTYYTRRTIAMFVTPIVLISLCIILPLATYPCVNRNKNQYSEL